MEENVQTVKPVTVMSVGFKYGLLSSLIGIVIFLVSAILGQNPFSTIWNVIAICLTIILMFLAHKNFKDNGDGFMSYGQGIGIGFWFTLLSTVLSILVMWTYLTVIDETPMTIFYDEQLAKMEKAGTPEEGIEMAMTWTKKLFWVFAVIGSLFWGMVIALILTIFTQKKSPEQTF